MHLLREHQSLTPRDFIDFLFAEFPPKHITVAKPFIRPENAKQIMLKLCSLYHPDRINREKFDAKYIVLCEEIAKIIDVKYQDLKMHGT